MEQKLKAFVFFKGRSIVFKDKGQILLLRLAQDLEDLAKVEQMPKLEGKRMIMILAPVSKNNCDNSKYRSKCQR